MVRNYTYLEIYLDDLNKKVSLSELEKHFKRPHQTVKNQLKILVKEKILLEDKRTRFLFYEINRDNPALKEYLSICEKEKMFRIMNQRPLIKRLYTLLAHEVENMLVFGSAATSEKFNDIDLLVISKNNIKKIIEDFEITYSVKVHIIQAEKKDLTKTFITEIRKKHMILKGHDFFVEMLYGRY
ncbi:hypothetical protein GQ472_02120 [archaeon]|nr:hypothetical protein [archaeon]